MYYSMISLYSVFYLLSLLVGIFSWSMFINFFNPDAWVCCSWFPSPLCHTCFCAMLLDPAGGQVLLFLHHYNLASALFLQKAAGYLVFGSLQFWFRASCSLYLKENLYLLSCLSLELLTCVYPWGTWSASLCKFLVHL